MTVESTFQLFLFGCRKKKVLFKVVSTVSLTQELKTLKRPKHGMNGHALVQHLSVLETGLRRTISEWLL